MKVELPPRPLPTTTTKNGNLPLDITSLQYHHTDDQKLQASTDDRTNANPPSTKPHLTPMPLDLLEPCSSHHSRSSETPSQQHPPAAGCEPRSSGTNRPDPDIVRQPSRVGNPADSPADMPAAAAYQMDISPEESAVLLQPLTEAALLRVTSGGVDLMADIPMIDADEETDSDPVAAKDTAKDTPLDPAPSPAVQAVLKSALKKGARPAAKKGLRVCFQSTSTFYIDTDAEANAEPQLMLVQSLDLPLVTATSTTDFRLYKQQQQMEGGATVSATVTTTTTTTTGSGLHEKKYTYEDAIVSLEHYSDILGPDRGGAHYLTSADKVRIGDTTDGADTVTCPPPSVEVVKPEPEVKTVECAVKTGEELVTSGEQANPSTGDSDSVQTLTVANLRLHEILTDVDTDPPPSDGDQPQPPVVEVAAPATPEVASATSSSTNLSPPLKELTVDVLSVSTPGAGESSGANWQVELSPLNSIPESETDSSNSSQDTIIMMTSEESQRNEKQIRRSLVARQQQLNGDAAASSSDSDDTVKCADQERPPAASTPSGSDDGRQCSSSEIRLIMERNAIRRSQLRYSNTQKKKSSEGGTVAPPLGEKHQQRTWKSQESLLDTIKLLTSDDDTSQQVDHERERTHRHHHKQEEPRHQELPPPRLLNGGTRTTDNNLSLQDIRGLIAAVKPVRGAGGQIAGQGAVQTRPVAVPGDIRQWKIQANLWDSVRGRRQVVNGQQESPPVVGNAAAPEEERTRYPATADLPRVSDPPVPSEEEDHYGYYGANGYIHMDEDSDELARFVHNDSDRLERLRKRYSYTDGEDYDSAGFNGGAFGARRPSVRGIKPRFGSTSEILKQMQGLLHTPPLANSTTNGHLTWSYMDTNGGGGAPTVRPSGNRQQQRHSTASSDSWMTSSGNYATLPTSFSGGLSPAVVSQLTGSRSVASLPTLHEEIYGVVRDRRLDDPVVRGRLGRDGNYVGGQPVQPPSAHCPPPYQPPPPPPAVNPAQHPQPPPYNHSHHHNHQQQRPPNQPDHQRPPHPHQPDHLRPPHPHQPVHPHLQQHQQQHTQPYQHHPHQQYNPQYFHPPHPKQYQHQGASVPNGVPPLVVAHHNGPVANSRPIFATAKDERGVPEGASASPKVTFDSLYAHVAPPSGKVSPVPHPTDILHRPATVTDSSGVVYYAMQV